MSTPTFIDTLKQEVARMQLAHPEREGELARAHALILHGHVVPSPTDAGTAQVLASDGQKTYHVNGTCDCQAGQHDKMCKHRQAWALYQFVAKRMAERKSEHVETAPGRNPPQHHEAPASVNLKVLVHGHEVMVTLRDSDETALLTRLQALLKRPDIRPIPAKPAPRAGGSYKGR